MKCALITFLTLPIRNFLRSESFFSNEKNNINKNKGKNIEQ